jgi:hypothetical protein
MGSLLSSGCFLERRPASQEICDSTKVQIGASPEKEFNQCFVIVTNSPAHRSPFQKTTGGERQPTRGIFSPSLA